MTPILLNRRGLIFGTALAMLYISIVPSYLHAGGSQSGNTTYYVQAGGSDGNDGLSRETSFQTLGKAVDTAKRSRIKRITVIGALMESSEQRTSFSRDPESVFFIKDSGRAEITIRGISRAGLNGAGSNKRVIKITGRSNIRFEYITLSNGLLNASNRGNGGGLYISDNAVITFGSGAVVTENSAVQGGGVFVLGSESAQARLILAGGRIINNRAEGSIGEAGAGVYMHYGSCRILAGEIAGNVAVDDNGGGSC